MGSTNTPSIRDDDLTALLRVCRTALYFVQHEVRWGPCKSCDPADEGREVWHDIATKLEEALAAFPEQFLAVCAEHDDETRRLSNAFWSLPND